MALLFASVIFFVYLCTRKIIKLFKFMPEISRFYGIVITMYNSEHNPPHFHIRYNDYRATMDINTGEINGNLPRRVLNLVYEWFDQHKDELQENWLRMEKGEEIINIKPLD